MKKLIREYQTNDTVYYVLDDQVRQEMIELVKIIRQETPSEKLNLHDYDVQLSMIKWLEEGRDFNKSQWNKFARMLEKYNLPTDIDELANSLDWTMGPPIDRIEMKVIMDMRRKKARAKLLGPKTQEDFIGPNSTYGKLFG